MQGGEGIHTPYEAPRYFGWLGLFCPPFLLTALLGTGEDWISCPLLPAVVEEWMVLDGYTNPAELDGCGGGGEMSRVFRRSAMATTPRTRIGRRHCMAKSGCHWIRCWVFFFICFIHPLLGSDVGA